MQIELVPNVLDTMTQLRVQEVLASFPAEMARKARTGQDFRDMAGNYWATIAAGRAACETQPSFVAILTHPVLQEVLASFLAKMPGQAHTGEDFRDMAGIYLAPNLADSTCESVQLWLSC